MDAQQVKIKTMDAIQTVRLENRKLFDAIFSQPTVAHTLSNVCDKIDNTCFVQFVSLLCTGFTNSRPFGF